MSNGVYRELDCLLPGTNGDGHGLAAGTRAPANVSARVLSQFNPSLGPFSHNCEPMFINLLYQN